MKIVWIVAAGALAGVVLAARRRTPKVPEVDRWAAATDPVGPSSNA